MRGPWVKICGMTRAEDIRHAASLGAHAVGIILVPESPRAVTPDAARTLLEVAPDSTARVAVTANLSARAMHAMISGSRFTAIQAHGEEPPELLERYPLPVVKAVRTRPELGVADLEMYRRWPLLLDGYAPDARGGTGRAADPELAVRLREAGFRILLAGGLAAGNLRSAVETVRPLAVDLNSGVEEAPGRKNPDAVRLA